MDNPANLEILWEDILSRQPDRIRNTFASLTVDERKAILTHLERMATEPGWHIEQQRSAESALMILKDLEI